MWSDEIREIRRLVAYERITVNLLDEFRTQAVRFFLEAFFYREQPDLAERLRRLGETNTSGTEAEAALSCAFLVGPNAPLSRTLFESYAPSFSLPGTGERRGGKVADLVAAVGDGVYALVEVKELFARGDKRNDRGTRLRLSQRVNKKQVRSYADAVRALEPAFLLVTNVAEWFLYDEEAARRAKPVAELDLDQVLKTRESGGTIGAYLGELCKRLD